MISLEIGGIFGFLTHFPFPPFLSRENLFPIVPVIIYGHSDLIAIKILKKNFDQKFSTETLSRKRRPWKNPGTKINFLPCLSRVIIFRKVTKFGGNRPKTKKLSTGKQNVRGKHLHPVLIGLKIKSSGESYYV